LESAEAMVKEEPNDKYEVLPYNFVTINTMTNLPVDTTIGIKNSI
jgi:hypothetical protein